MYEVKMLKWYEESLSEDANQSPTGSCTLLIVTASCVSGDGHTETDHAQVSQQTADPTHAAMKF